MSQLRSFLLAIFFLFSFTQTVTSQNPHQEKHVETIIDSTSTTSHDMGAGSPFDHGLEMLHHMMYEQAATLFQEALDADANNAIAHWGIAMTVLRPLLAAPNTKDFAKGLAAIEKAMSTDTPSEKEQEDIQALYTFYSTANKVGYLQGLEAWKNSLEALHMQNLILSIKSN